MVKSGLFLERKASNKRDVYIKYTNRYTDWNDIITVSKEDMGLGILSLRLSEYV
jgi:hypothetical protein